MEGQASERPYIPIEDIKCYKVSILIQLVLRSARLMVLSFPVRP